MSNEHTSIVDTGGPQGSFAEFVGKIMAHFADTDTDYCEFEFNGADEFGRRIQLQMTAKLVKDSHG